MSQLVLSTLEVVKAATFSGSPYGAGDRLPLEHQSSFERRWACVSPPPVCLPNFQGWGQMFGTLLSDHSFGSVVLELSAVFGLGR